MRKYGLIDYENLIELSEEVCNCLGYGANKNAHKLLVETAGAETLHGRQKDMSDGAGMGLTQFDELPFEDTKKRARDSDKSKIYEYFDIDLEKVEWEHLRYNPLLALIFARLKYKKVPEIIPMTKEGRAIYYKKWYNSLVGKGTVFHYLRSNNFDMSAYSLDMEVDDESRKRVQRLQKK